tara:strand:- start:1828 stop:2091 length:264 start_codon:yes stop_codon:yes gene_type:complete
MSKFIAGIVIACAITIGSSSTASADCCDGPVRKVVKATACTPVRVVRAVREAQPVRRVASLPCRVAQRWAEAKPVRSTLKRVCCGCR